MVSEVDPSVANAVARAAAVFRVAITAGPESSVFAARDALAGITDPDELRMVAAVVTAVSASLLMSAAGIPDGPLRRAVDWIAAEVTWAAS